MPGTGQVSGMDHVPHAVLKWHCPCMNCCEQFCTEADQAVRHTVYLFDGFQLDVTRRKLISSGGLVQPLHSRAMDALLLLVANAGELVEKRRLLQTVWPNAIVEDNNLNQCVLAIRKALGEAAGSNRYVMTVPGRGYRFVCPVRVIVQESTAENAPVPPAQAGRSRFMPWIAAATGACLLLVALLWRLTIVPAIPAAAGRNLAPGIGPRPEIVLRLRRPRAAADDPQAADPAQMLARCLAARPQMQLRVRVQLVDVAGTPLWSGDYIAGPQDLLALQPGADAGTADCRELLAASASRILTQK